MVAAVIGMKGLPAPLSHSLGVQQSDQAVVTKEGKTHRQESKKHSTRQSYQSGGGALDTDSLGELAV